MRGFAVRVWGWLRALLPDVRDLHVYGGGSLLAAGVWTVWEPLGMVVFGALLLYLGLTMPGGE